MANTLHKTLTGADLHIPGYRQNSDPGAVGAGIEWLDTSTSPPTLKRRNTGNAGWDIPSTLSYTAENVANKSTDQTMGGGTPSNTLYPSQAAVQAYANAVAAGLIEKTAVDLATAAALPAGTYANGTAGVGATFTVTATGTLTIDGVLTTLGMRILVKNQVAGLQNGIYTITTAGAVGVSAVLTRATDSDTGAELLDGLYGVTLGNTLANTFWYLTNATAPTVGTDALTYSQFTPSSQGGGSNIKVDSSLTKNGNTLGRAALTGDVTASAGSNTTVVAGVAAATKQINAAKGANVAAANNLVLGADGNTFHITGSTQINLLASTNFQAGSTVVLIFDSTPLVKHNQTASGANKPILLVGGVDYTAAANDVMVLTYDGTSWYEHRNGSLSMLGIVPINAQSGTTYTFALADRGYLVTGSNGSATTFTIPANASVPFPVGTTINICQLGAGQITIAITSDTLSGKNGLKCSGQYAVVSIVKTASTTWILSGDSAT